MYPEWVPIEYSFIFNNNGGSGVVPDSLSSVTIITGVTIPGVDITRTGYQATVWNTSPSGSGTDISPGHLNITAEIINSCFASGETVDLYPKWEITRYRLSFNTENTQGTAPSPLNDITIGLTITLPSPSFSRTGYRMVGWNTGNDSSGTSLSIGDVTVDAAFIEGVFTDGTEKVLYPEWVPIGYSFIFNSNGGSGNVPSPLAFVTVITGTNIPEVNITRTGYQATVWNTRPDGSGIDIRPGHLNIIAAVINGCFISGESVNLYPKWEMIGYRITFNIENTQGTSPLPQSDLTIGSVISLPPPSFTRIGYRMVGWNTADDGSGISLSVGNVTIDADFLEMLFTDGTERVLYPEWVPIGYSFTFDSNGGVGNPPDTLSSVTVVTGATMPNIPFTRTGYEASTWNTRSDGSGADIRPGNLWMTPEMITNCFGDGESVILYPKWSAIRYRVSFNIENTQGTSPLPLNNIMIGSPIVLPEASFTRTGYSMVGWNTADDGSGMPLTSGEAIVDAAFIERVFTNGTEVTLFPEWTPVRYSLSFGTNGGDGVVPDTLSSLTVLSGAVIPELTITRTGYQAAVWNTSPDGTGFDIRPGSLNITSEIIRDCFGPNEDATLYPKWTAVMYSILFNTDNTQGTAPSPLNNITIGSTVSLPSPTFSRTGYDMVGWNTGTESSGTSLPIGGLTIDSVFIEEYLSGTTERTLYPEWVPIGYSFIFNANGGSGALPDMISSATVVTGVTIPDISLTKTGYQATVWSTSPDGSGIDISPGPLSITPGIIDGCFASSENATLYPKWVAVGYRITFNIENTQGTTPNPLNNITIGSSIVLPSPSFTRIGYEMVGWNTADDGSGVPLSIGGTIVDASFLERIFDNGTERTLYPEWMPVQYSFSFDANGGDGTIPSTISFVTVVTGTVIPTVGITKTGYQATVWNTSPDGTGTDIGSGPLSVTAGLISVCFGSDESVVLYPKWSAVNYSIMFNTDNTQGTAPLPLNNIMIGNTVSLPSATFSRIGYNMVGWNTGDSTSGTSLSFGNLTIDADFIEGFFGNETGLILYPEWVPIRYSFVFNGNGGTGNLPGTLSSVTVVTGADVPAVDMTRTGYSARVWNTSPEGTGTDIGPGHLSITADIIDACFPSGETVILYPKWTAIQYRITFNAENTQGTTPNPLNDIVIGTTITLPEASFSRTGYDMAGWNDGSGSLLPSEITVDEAFIERIFTNGTDATLYPEWIPVEYSFVFNNNGGNGTVPDRLSSLTVISGAIIPEVNITKTGYSATVWNTSSDGTGIDVASGSLSITSDIIRDCFGSNNTVTLYPKWSAVRYSLLFNTDNTQGTAPLPMRDITIGSTITLPSPTFTRTGYRMVGWNTGENTSGTSLSVGESTIDPGFIEDVFASSTEKVLYPEWMPIVYSFAFNSNGGFGDVPSTLSPITVVSGAVIPSIGLTKTGYQATVWNTSSDGRGIDIDPGSLTITAEIISGCFGANGVATLYPKWTVIGYRLSFNIENTQGTTPDPLNNITIGSSIILPSQSFTRTGYSMVGWNTADDGSGISFSVGEATVDATFIENIFVNGNERTLYPEWVPIDYSFIFDANDGVGTVPDTISSVTVISGARIPDVNIERVGYDATVWNTSPVGNGIDVRPGDLSITADIINSCFGSDVSVTLYPKWTTRGYTILFNAENTVGVIPGPLGGITIGSSVTLPSPQFSRTGYRMIGWNTGIDGSGMSLPIGDATADADYLENVFGNGLTRTLYPEWVPIGYSFAFNANGGSGIVPNTLSHVTIVSGAVIPEVEIARTGYQATVWNTSPDGGGTDVRSGQLTISGEFIQSCFQSNESITLYPKWIAVRYSISFNTDNTQGTAPSPLSNITIGSVITLPSPTFSRVGYNMVCWNTGDNTSGTSLSIGDLTVDATFIESVFSSTSERTLYPEWVPISYSFVFNANGGSGDVPITISSVTVITGAYIPAVGLTRTGYRAAVWNTSPDGSGTDINPGSLTIDSAIISRCFDANGTAALYPKWEMIGYRIMFNIENTQGTTPVPLNNITIGSSITLPSPSFTRTGYTMTGWNTSNDGSGTSLSIGDATVDASFIERIFTNGTERILYPEWTPVLYSFSFDANGGIGTIPDTLSSVTMVSGTTIPSVGMTRAGYQAMVWNTSSDGRGMDIAPGRLTMTAETVNGCFGSDITVTLYPKWSVVSYSISFNTDNTQGTAPLPLNGITIGSFISLPSPSFTRIGYEMTGWNTGAESSGTSLSIGRKTVNAEFLERLFVNGTSATLYPEWVPINYSFVFNANGGSGDVPTALSSVTVITGATIPAIGLTRTGYQATVWNTSFDGSGTDINPGSLTIDSTVIGGCFGLGETVTLYPKWTAIGYRLSFNIENTQGTTPDPLNNITIGSSITLPSQSFTRTGYRMVGWNTADGGTGIPLSIGDATVDASFIESIFTNGTERILYPEWTPVLYSFLFDTNGGSGVAPGTLSPVTISSGTTIPAVGIMRTGYQATVWNTSPDGRGMDIIPGSLTITVETINGCFGSDTVATLYPKWTAREYSILFNTENTTGAAPNPLSRIAIGSTIVLPSPTFSRAGYDMVGWNTGVNASGTSLSIGDHIVDGTFIEGMFGNVTEMTLYPEWIPINYNFIFNANGGTGNLPNTLSSVTVATGAVMPDVDIRRTGYQATIWNTSPDGSGTDVGPGSLNITADIIGTCFPSGDTVNLYPKWTAVAYRLSFNTENTIGTAPNPLNNITIGSSITLPEASFSRTGYDMVGWNTGIDGSGISLSPGGVSVDSVFIENIFTNGTEATLYPEWIPIQYSFSFNSNGGNGTVPNTLSSLSVVSGTVIPEVGVTRTGYQATMWNTSPDGSGTDIRPGTLNITAEIIDTCFPSDDVATLYPKWSAVRYSILFNTENTQGAIPDPLNDIMIGTAVMLPSPFFSRTGYSMAGWNTGNESSGTSLSIGSVTVDAAFIEGIFSNGTAVTLYPEWIPIQYSFAFNNNGGIGEVPGTLSSVTTVTGTTIPSVGIMRTGYQANVWNTSPDGNGTDVMPGHLNMSPETISNCFGSNVTVTLYPKWTVKEYSIMFNTENTVGSAPGPLNRITIGTTITLPSPSFTRIGYDMAGWNTGIDGTGVSLSIGAVTVDADCLERVFTGGTAVTLYPEWIPIQYSFAFNNNGGIGNTPGTLSSVTVISGAVIPDVDFDRTGYNSMMWNTSVDGSGIDIRPGSLRLTSEIIESCFGSGHSVVLYPKWAVNRYTILFNTENTIGTAPNPLNNITIGSSITLPEASFSRTGYEMVGWNTGSAPSLSPGSIIMDEMFIERTFAEGTEVTLYPEWTPVEYSFDFSLNGGVGDVPDVLSSLTITSGAVIPGMSIKRTGYEATVWNTSPDGTGTDIRPGQLDITAEIISSCFQSDDAAILYPKWSVKKYSILFNTENTQGAIPEPLNDITIGMTVSLPSPSFTRTGYDMVGWNTGSESSGTSLPIGSVAVDAAFIEGIFSNGTGATLYPEWVPINYVFVFNANGGIGELPGTLSSVTVVTGATIPTIGITMTGYTATVWNTSQDGTGTDIRPGVLTVTAETVGLCFGTGREVTLYPKWIAVNYRLSFNTENTQGTSPNPLNGITIGMNVILPSPTFSRKGYEMVGWNTGIDGSGTALPIGSIPADAAFIESVFINGTERTLYPEWIPVQYSFSFDANGGTGDAPGALSSLTVISGAAIPTVNIKKTGYTATVWNTSSDGTGIDIGSGQLAITDDIIDSCFSSGGNATLYPKWVAIRYRLSFNNENTQGSTPAPLTNITIGGTISLPSPTFSRPGYEMAGWNTGNDGSGHTLSIGNTAVDPDFISTVFTNGNESTLYPEWIPIRYSFSFSPNGGNGTVPDTLSPLTVVSGASIPDVGVKRTGYDATMWNTSSDGTGMDIRPGTLAINETIIDGCFGVGETSVLYPKWIERTYTIIFNTEDTYGTTPDPLNNLTIGSTIVLPEGSFSRTGYDMAGWNTRNDSAGLSLDVGERVFGESFIQDVFTDGGEVTLYPIWTVISYRLNLTTEQGGITDVQWSRDGMTYSREYTIESETITLPSAESDDAFYRFVCWEDMNGMTVSSVPGGSHGDISLSAVWALKEMTVNIMVNGRTITDTYTLDSTLEEPESEDGFTFKGWYYRDQEGNEIQFVSMSQMYEGISIYAVFEPVEEDHTETIVFAAVLTVVFLAMMFLVIRRR